MVYRSATLGDNLFKQQYIYREVRLPSPANAPLAIDEIALLNRRLRARECYIICSTSENTYIDVKESSPEKAPIGIDVMTLSFNGLHATQLFNQSALARNCFTE